ncbi:hypothetical protein ACFP63_02905 [Oerskovia jenensis]|uniref:Uncharacterized protein n=1 Tax=Oerskovia jenensis TaxID=162169 RepID=A0ABS2LBU5_9CELL|nr:hypothetical protein [Oerskovia jenensis]MBM7477900.1 hypothetical protein [Oerskovia jenensis]
MTAPSGRAGQDDASPESDRAVVPAATTGSPRAHSSLRWPAVVALTAALAFAGLVAAGVFDPMIAAL